MSTSSMNRFASLVRLAIPLLAACGAPDARAQVSLNLLLDDFEQPNQSVNTGSTNPASHTLTDTGGWFIGSFRTLGLFTKNKDSGNPEGHALNILSSGPDTDGYLELLTRSSFASVSTITYEGTDMDLSLAGNESFVFNIASQDLEAEWKLTLWDGATSSSHAVTRSGGGGALYMAFSDFSGFTSSNFSSVDKIEITVTSGADVGGLDLTLHNFGVIPEPGSAAFLLASWPLLFRRLKKTAAL